MQRLRDQIKTWQGDSSIKDKTKLDANRKLIEEKMEKFKICEKETKTKAFSKEGLAQDRTDPRQKAKAEINEWVKDAISKLKEQSDEMEAEIESLNSGKRKKRAEENPRAQNSKNTLAVTNIMSLCSNASCAPSTTMPSHQTRPSSSEKASITILKVIRTPISTKTMKCTIRLTLTPYPPRLQPPASPERVTTKTKTNITHQVLPPIAAQRGREATLPTPQKVTLPAQSPAPLETIIVAVLPRIRVVVAQSRQKRKPSLLHHRHITHRHMYIMAITLARFLPRAR